MDTTTFPESANMPRPMPVIQPFAGRIGGNQALVVDRHDPSNADLLKKTPDAAPLMTVREGFDLRGFWDIDLWKYYDDGLRNLLDGHTTTFRVGECHSDYTSRRVLYRGILGTNIRWS
ncbi:hypothetical protein APSETT444_001739 [Aspergillus pseudonomiae]